VDSTLQNHTHDAGTGRALGLKQRGDIGQPVARKRPCASHGVCWERIGPCCRVPYCSERKGLLQVAGGASKIFRWVFCGDITKLGAFGPALPCKKTPLLPHFLVHRCSTYVMGVTHSPRGRDDPVMRTDVIIATSFYSWSSP
jgi:hypothetical protein